MATRIKLKRSLKRGIKFVEDHPVSVSGATFAASTANLITNRSRHDKDRDYQEKQLKAMENLTSQLKKNASSMNEVTKTLQDKEEKKGGSSVKFSLKKTDKENER